MDVEGLAILGCTEPHVAKLVPDFLEVFFARNRIALLGKIVSHYAAADTSELSRIEHGSFQGTPRGSSFALQPGGTVASTMEPSCEAHRKHMPSDHPGIGMTAYGTDQRSTPPRRSRQ